MDETMVQVQAADAWSGFHRAGTPLGRWGAGESDISLALDDIAMGVSGELGVRSLSGDAPARRCAWSSGKTVDGCGTGSMPWSSHGPGGCNGGAQTRSVGAGPLAKMVL